MNRDMFEVGGLQKKKRSKRKRARLPYAAKAQHVITMMDRNAAELTERRGVSGWGFNLTQIATMTCYERSTALLNDLFKMCDDGLLIMMSKPRCRGGFGEYEYWFYTPDEHKRALKQKRLVS
jgi:hypothetical protein